MTTPQRLRLALPVTVAGLVLIGFAQGVPNRHSIEDSLTQRSTLALQAAGLTGFQVSFAGRDGSLVLAQQSDVDKARDLVARLEGVRAVDARALPQPSAVVTVDGTRVTVTGRVPTDALVAALGAGRDQLTVDGGVSDMGLGGLPAIVRALGGNAKGVIVELRDGRITLSGKVDSAAVREAVVSAAGQDVGVSNVVDRLEIPVTPPEAIQQALAGLPQITFENDRATLTAAGQAAVAQAAGLLKTSPSAKVRVEGHTDSNGTPESNRVLSQARADTVLNSLLALGIAADRMTAVGLGASLPKVPNTSDENRAINRRVELVVL